MNYQNLLKPVWWHTFVEMEWSQWFLQLRAATGAKNIRPSILLDPTDDLSSEQEVSFLIFTKAIENDTIYLWPKKIRYFLEDNRVKVIWSVDLQRFVWKSPGVTSSTRGKSFVAAPLNIELKIRIYQGRIWYTLLPSVCIFLDSSNTFLQLELKTYTQCQLVMEAAI